MYICGGVGGGKIGVTITMDFLENTENTQGVAPEKNIKKLLKKILKYFSCKVGKIWVLCKPKNKTF